MEKNDNKRLNRVSEAYQHELAQMLHLEVRDPRLAGVWITRVKFTPDLRLAKVYFNVDGGRVREEEVLYGFERSKGFLRHELAQRVQLKFAPELKFYYDESAEVGERLDELFRQIDEQKQPETK
jgi:ribosome-binding factor A